MRKKELSWNRGTILKGKHELESGFTSIDNFSGRGRKRAEESWPRLEQDIREIVGPQSQIDPSFKTKRQYTRLSAEEVRRQLIEQKGYSETNVSSAIFEEVHRVNKDADGRADTLRVSLDAKAVVSIGELSRDGYNRVAVAAADHDFKPDATVTPFGFLLPRYGDLFLCLGTSKITSDFIVDRLEDLWRNNLHPRFSLVSTLVLNLDNGPENHSRRTQFINRLVDFVAANQVAVQLAYYPPYHSKYNPIEHCWSCLEQHWNGNLLDELDTVVRFAQSMTWQGKHPVVAVVTTLYKTGVRLTKVAMAELETRIKRLPSLEK